MSSPASAIIAVRTWSSRPREEAKATRPPKRLAASASTSSAEAPSNSASRAVTVSGCVMESPRVSWAACQCKSLTEQIIGLHTTTKPAWVQADLGVSSRGGRAGWGRRGPRRGPTTGRSRDGLKGRLHHVSHTADGGVAPQVVIGAGTLAPAVAQRLDGHVDADLVAVLEAHDHPLPSGAPCSLQISDPQGGGDGATSQDAHRLHAA